MLFFFIILIMIYFYVLVLFIFIQDWRFIKALLSKVGEDSFINKLHNIDCSKISPDTAKKAKEWIKHVESSAQVKCVSLAGSQIHLWVSDCRHFLQNFKIKTFIRKKTCPCNVYPFEPHFYIAKLGYARVYLFFLFLLKNIDCVYSLETTCIHTLFFEQK